ncbi:hypothetical protein HPB48_005778 [Haemaphysalis longicornis]|uniref:Uncharacterized protein n=1 Tax=Haemaphysalis longicornis TaxID=44386 RepID=A0A9J6FQV0_HAELO|nr:hypothetical protein HPB48_005778 [Haemaphysalis longicornis]
MSSSAACLELSPSHLDEKSSDAEDVMAYQTSDEGDYTAENSSAGNASSKWINVVSHRFTACPFPNVRACPTCGTRDPADGHVCIPRCSLCKGEHLKASKGCPQRFCEPYVKRQKELARQPACTTTWPPSTETWEHPSPPGLLLFIVKELSIAVPVPVKILQPFFKGRQHH